VINASLDIADPRVMNLLQRLPLAIAAVNRAGDVVLINERAMQLSGYTREDTPTLAEWRRKAFPDPSYRAAVTAVWDADVASAQRADAAIEPRDIVIVDKSGGTRTVSIMGIPLNGGFLAVFFDHTERLQVQAQLREAHKLQAVSTLAGGIAHEFNNLLAVMLMHVNMASTSPDAPASWTERLRDMEDVLRQARRLIGELLEFAGKPAANHQPHAIGPILEDVARLVRPSVPRGVELQLRIDPTLAPVLADRTQITQLALNLVMNAVDAMRDRQGWIRLSVQSVEADGDSDLPAPLKNGRYCVVSVGDQGCGMTPETQRRIFEPFFTTKAVGQGTGLGLAVAQGIAQSHRGLIVVHSQPGSGSEFRVFLPASAAH
jgi:two-component system, cell cycle sensor histidine kinase and response regulator CckA